MDTKSIFYRCFPLYEENVTTVEICANPKGAKVDDPSCSKKIVTEVKETEAPSKKNPVFEQLNSAVGVFMRYFADLSNIVQLLCFLVYLILSNLAHCVNI